MKNTLNGITYLKQLEQENGSRKSEHRQWMQFMSDKAKKMGVPLAGHFELTPLCNFDCRMCYVHLMKNQLGGSSLLTAEQWKDLMRQAWEAGMMQAALSGGECLAYPGFREIFLYLQSLGVRVCVMTNGYLLDEEMIRFFEAHRPSVIQITLYGWNDDVYERVTGQRAFTTVANNIRRLVGTGIEVTLTLTPSRYLGEDVLETLRVAYDLHNEVRINPFLTLPREETGRAGISHDMDPEMYVRLYRLQAELLGVKVQEDFEGVLPEPGGSCRECREYGMRCGGGRYAFAADWKGNLTFCSSLDAVKCSALEEGFLPAWKKLNQAAKEWPFARECDDCAYKAVCNTCAAYQYQFAGPGERPAALCEWTQCMVRHGIKSSPACE